MTLELLVLNKDWLFGLNQDGIRFEGLSKLINKAYYKARYKFDVITTPRIKNPKCFLDDLQISEKDDICLFIMLGKEEIFAELHQRDNYRRNFNSPTTNLIDSFNCDIPDKYYGLLSLENNPDITIKVANPDYVVDDQVLNRTLGTVGIKRYHGKPHLKANELQLTSFTSFMRNAGPRILDIVIERYLLQHNNNFICTTTEKIILQAEVVREHKLVEYYTSKCGFKESHDILVKVNENGYLLDNPFKESMQATRDFHVTYIFREILSR